VQRRGHEQADDEEDARQAQTAEPPAERGEDGDEAAEEEVSLRDVPRREQGLSLFAVGAGQSARGPVRLRRVTAARTVEGGDVLQRNEDVAVELDVRDPFDPAVGGKRPVLILAAEELDFDLLSLVLVGVVLHGFSV
jgi:hypothetical protein